MQEIIKEFIPKLGIPTVMLSVFLLIIRLRPITLFTSSTIEMKLLSKEKKLSIKIIKFLAEVILIIAVLLMLSDSVFELGILFNGYVASIWFISLLLIYFITTLLLEIKEKNFFSFFGSLSNKYRIPIFIVLMAIFMSYYLFVAYFVGTQLFTNIHNKELSTSQQLGVLIAIIFLYFIIAAFNLIPINKLIYNFFEFKRLNPNSTKDKPVFLEFEGVNWYLYHPINDSTFYLGNKASLSSSTKFRFISKDELLKKTLEVGNFE